ncbi:MAG: hypothetical protein IPL39_18055 [Opitutaceae bacterium]|nr:hypothetical protein [Opitutaceae bacterium]
MKRELNEYLFLEFGVEGTELQISESWPFELKEVGVVEGEHVFEFENDDEEFLAVYGRCLRFESKDGADLELLGRQIRGSRWIGARGPVSLSTSRGEHPVVPMIPERRTKIEELACGLGRTGVPQILEGLFLEKSREYLALVELPDEEVVHVVGSSIQIPDIPKSAVSAWKVLSRAVGGRI